ncbi:hypothetical protein D3C77_599540 [compost metagenome]
MKCLKAPSSLRCNLTRMINMSHYINSLLRRGISTNHVQQLFIFINAHRVKHWNFRAKPNDFDMFNFTQTLKNSTQLLCSKNKAVATSQQYVVNFWVLGDIINSWLHIRHSLFYIVTEQTLAETIATVCATHL